MEINDFANNLYLKDGIWFSTNNKEISYPKEGNKVCFEIEKDSFWFQHRNHCIIEAVKKYSPDDIFFDIGGGNGFVSKGLEDQNIKTVLIEPGINGVLNAQARGLKNIICSTFEDAGIKQNSCKSIGLFDVVEHIEDDKHFLKSINSILSHNGLVYITVPAHKILWSNEDDLAGHFRLYTLKTISNALKKSGFAIEYATYFFSILPIPIFIFRSLPSLLRLNNNSTRVDKNKNEHAPKKGMLSSILNKIWLKELNYIKQGKKISFGGSCLVVARKIADRTINS